MMESNMMHAARAINEFCAVPIEYIRGALRVPLAARPSNAIWQSSGEDGIIDEFHGMDWIATAIEWDRVRLGDPLAGDRIRWQQHGKQRLYECMAISGGQPFETPAYSETITIHTKEIPNQ